MDEEVVVNSGYESRSESIKRYEETHKGRKVIDWNKTSIPMQVKAEEMKGHGGLWQTFIFLGEEKKLIDGNDDDVISAFVSDLAIKPEIANRFEPSTVHVSRVDKKPIDPAKPTKTLFFVTGVPKLIE